jgi:peroxiredoxin
MINNAKKLVNAMKNFALSQIQKMLISLDLFFTSQKMCRRHQLKQLATLQNIANKKNNTFEIVIEI